MSKRQFSIPTVILSSGLTPGGGPDPGLGTGIGTPDTDLPMDWMDWSVNYEWYDGDNNGVPGEWDDYVKWWQGNGWTEDEFKDWNQGKGYADGPY